MWFQVNRSHRGRFCRPSRQLWVALGWPCHGHQARLALVAGTEGQLGWSAGLQKCTLGHEQVRSLCPEESLQVGAAVRQGWQKESRLASWQHQMFSEETEVFFLWIALSLFLQINLVIADDSAAASAGLSLLVPWCVHGGSWFLPSSRFWVCLGSFICKCHLLWQTTGPEDSQGPVESQLGLLCVGVLGTMGAAFSGALVDPHYLASTELMSHWMALRNSEEPQGTLHNIKYNWKMLYIACV